MSIGKSHPENCKGNVQPSNKSKEQELGNMLCCFEGYRLFEGLDHNSRNVHRLFSKNPFWEVRQKRVSPESYKGVLSSSALETEGRVEQKAHVEEHGVLAFGNQWEAILRRTTDGNMVKETDKQTIDSLGLCFGFRQRIPPLLAAVSVYAGHNLTSIHLPGCDLGSIVVPPCTRFRKYWFGKALETHLSAGSGKYLHGKLWKCICMRGLESTFKGKLWKRC
ncbi:hypothetical protein DFH08DRAFT_801569 [Mycena albidolilacea]|uniref:Uncharacterized protein n=1 Tax=Mycena albidolilacea TaxID=1033008 RepID=A0AAD7F140_9AGAR|nr:hypothetical protein DFH08DRAFT_801569 [Mycena albidolilacea]